MKKALSLVLALCMAASLLSGCGKKEQPNPPSSDGTTSQNRTGHRSYCRKAHAA